MHDSNKSKNFLNVRRGPKPPLPEHFTASVAPVLLPPLTASNENLGGAWKRGKGTQKASYSVSISVIRERGSVLYLGMAMEILNLP